MGIFRHHFPDPASAGEAVAGFLAARLSEGLDRPGRASLVVTGGGSPRFVYPHLAQAPLPWERISITLSDERLVPPERPESNERLVRELLLAGPAGRADFVGLWSGAEDAQAACAATERRLAALPRPFDAVYLGLGDDGHVASLFPGTPALDHRGGLCVAGLAPAEPRRRISLTFEALLDSRAIVLLVAGAKRRLLDDPRGLPVGRLLGQERVPVHLFTCA